MNGASRWLEARTVPERAIEIAREIVSAVAAATVPAPLTTPVVAATAALERCRIAVPSLQGGLVGPPASTGERDVRMQWCENFFRAAMFPVWDRAHGAHNLSVTP